MKSIWKARSFVVLNILNFSCTPWKPVCSVTPQEAHLITAPRCSPCQGAATTTPRMEIKRAAWLHWESQDIPCMWNYFIFKISAYLCCHLQKHVFMLKYIHPTETQISLGFDISSGDLQDPHRVLNICELSSDRKKKKPLLEIKKPWI